MKAQRRHVQGHRQEQLLQEFVHDTYKSKRKLPEPTQCKDCGALWRRGRWSWAAAPAGAHAGRCPACKRMRDRFPAGRVSLQGEFLAAHRDEVLRRVRRCEAAEKRGHPLERIMAIEADGKGVLVTTTGLHLARRIGDALQHAYKGELAYRYHKADNLLRVSWSR
ncbi:MAG: BCAM0308 family protein [Betaproteobacteria bacterium]|nr:BCAM0308 family protein [Betaproteobacteria bacterium]MDH5210673.1 BCAM0308 family protein [Betaproteobacteria bacterium]